MITIIKVWIVSWKYYSLELVLSKVGDIECIECRMKFSSDLAICVWVTQEHIFTDIITPADFCPVHYFCLGGWGWKREKQITRLLLHSSPLSCLSCTYLSLAGGRICIMFFPWLSFRIFWCFGTFALCGLLLFFFFFCQAHGMRKFPGLGSNLHHSSDNTC